MSVWYEHNQDILSKDASDALERLVFRSLMPKEGGGVRVHSYEVGGMLAPPRLPEPDFSVKHAPISCGRRRKRHFFGRDAGVYGLAERGPDLIGAEGALQIVIGKDWFLRAP